MRGRLKVFIYCIFVLLVAFSKKAFATEVTVLSEAPSTVRVYEPYFLSFTVPTVSVYPFFPFDQSVPPGISPGLGVSVDGLIVHGGKTITHPAFYMTQTVKVGSRFELTNKLLWQLRFSPQEVGDYDVSIRVQDANGVYVTHIGSFTASASVKQGYIAVSKYDARYFAFTNGDIYWPIGPAAGDNYTQYNGTGQNLERPWMAGRGAYSTNWARWKSSAEQFGNEGMMTRLSFREHAPGSELSYELSAPDGYRIWLTGWTDELFYTPPKPSTTYRLVLRYKTSALTGPRISGFPYGLVIRVHDPTWGNPTRDQVEQLFRDKPALIDHIMQNNDWTTIDKTITLPSAIGTDISLYLDNVTGGSAYIDEFSLTDALTGTQLIRNPKADMHTYVEQRSAAYFDWQVNEAEKNGVFLKYVVHDKNDWIQNHLKQDGSWADAGDGYYQPVGTKASWLLRAWYRYIAARWGYSTAVFSWELNNEGPPNESSGGTSPHWQAAEEFGKFMHTIDAHPHLVSTSFWCCWRPSFWANTGGKFPNIDFADIHDYLGNATIQELGGSASLDDILGWNVDLAEIILRDKIKKPVMRGESGITVQPNWWEPYPELKQANSGVWYKQLLWAGLSEGALFDPNYWYSEHLNQIDRMSLSKPFWEFVKRLDVHKGGYSTLASAVSNPRIRVIGQKNITSGKAHGYIVNTEYTWKSDSAKTQINPISGTVAFVLSPFVDYPVTYWDTMVSSKMLRSFTLRSDSGGKIVLPVDSLTTDFAFTIGSSDLPSNTGILHPATIPGDVNGDNTVNVIDVRYLQSNFASIGSVLYKYANMIRYYGH